PSTSSTVAVGLAATSWLSRLTRTCTTTPPGRDGVTASSTATIRGFPSCATAALMLAVAATARASPEIALMVRRDGRYCRAIARSPWGRVVLTQRRQPPVRRTYSTSADSSWPEEDQDAVEALLAYDARLQVVVERRVLVDQQEVPAVHPGRPRQATEHGAPP